MDFILDRTLFTKYETRQEIDDLMGIDEEVIQNKPEGQPPELKQQKSSENGGDGEGTGAGEGEGITYGIEHLIAEGTYVAAYPLHDSDVEPVPAKHSHTCSQSGVSRSKQGSPAHENKSARATATPERPPEELLKRHRLRTLLYKHWGSWSNTLSFRFQPLDHVRAYLGEQFALYFAWLGFYTLMLIPASIVGFIVFVHGIRLVWFSDDPVACVAFSPNS